MTLQTWTDNITSFPQSRTILLSVQKPTMSRQIPSHHCKGALHIRWQSFSSLDCKIVCWICVPWFHNWAVMVCFPVALHLQGTSSEYFGWTFACDCVLHHKLNFSGHSFERHGFTLSQSDNCSPPDYLLCNHCIARDHHFTTLWLICQQAYLSH